MRAYIITDNNMSVSAAFEKREELLKQINAHLDDLENDRDIQKSLDGDACISITIEVAEISDEEFNKINSAHQ